MIEIKYKRTVAFEGRNGLFKQGGIVIRVSDYGKTITMFPLTLKGIIARCMIEIPLENMQEIIHELKSIELKLKRIGE